jgi:site-specific DNA recombinase
MRILRGESLHSVCVDFNGRGIPRVGGGAWQPPPLRRILTSGRVAGWSTYRGEIVGKSPTNGILTRRQTERLTALFADPARRTNGGRMAGHSSTGASPAADAVSASTRDGHRGDRDTLG